MQLRHLTTPAYLLAALLVLFPLVDLFVGVYPMRPSEVSWRFVEQRPKPGLVMIR